MSRWYWTTATMIFSHNLDFSCNLYPSSRIVRIGMR